MRSKVSLKIFWEAHFNTKQQFSINFSQTPEILNFLKNFFVSFRRILATPGKYWMKISVEKPVVLVIRKVHRNCNIFRIILGTPDNFEY